MKKLLSLVVLLAVSAASAFADTYRTFNIDATLNSGTVSGTVTEDVTTGAFTASNITAFYSGVTYHFTGASVLDDVEPLYDRVHFGNDALNPGTFFATDFFATTPIGYDGGLLCSIANPCVGTGALAGSTVESALGSGSSTITDVVDAGILAPTPEPGSLALLGTGTLTLIGAVRRRISTR